MYGILEYDGDGNLIAKLNLFTNNTVDPVIGQVTVAQQVGVLDAYGKDTNYEELDEGCQAEVVRRLADILTERITNTTHVRPFVNSSNGHPDLITAVRRAIEPGGPVQLITFRVTV